MGQGEVGACLATPTAAHSPPPVGQDARRTADTFFAGVRGLGLLPRRHGLVLLLPLHQGLLAGQVPGGVVLRHQGVQVDGAHGVLDALRATPAQVTVPILPRALPLFALQPQGLVFRDAELLPLELDLRLQDLQGVDLVLGRGAGGGPHLLHARRAGVRARRAAEPVAVGGRGRCIEEAEGQGLLSVEQRVLPAGQLGRAAQQRAARGLGAGVVGAGGHLVFVAVAGADLVGKVHVRGAAVRLGHALDAAVQRGHEVGLLAQQQLAALAPGGRGQGLIVGRAPAALRARGPRRPPRGRRRRLPRADARPAALRGRELLKEGAGADVPAVPFPAAPPPPAARLPLAAGRRLQREAGREAALGGQQRGGLARAPARRRPRREVVRGGGRRRVGLGLAQLALGLGRALLVEGDVEVGGAQAGDHVLAGGGEGGQAALSEDVVLAGRLAEGAQRQRAQLAGGGPRRRRRRAVMPRLPVKKIRKQLKLLLLLALLTSAAWFTYLHISLVRQGRALRLPFTYGRGNPPISRGSGLPPGVRSGPRWGHVGAWGGQRVGLGGG